MNNDNYYTDNMITALSSDVLNEAKSSVSNKIRSDDIYKNKCMLT